MKKDYLKFGMTTILVLSFILMGFSQNRNSVWTNIDKNDISSTNLVARQSAPKKGMFYRLNINQLKDQLRDAPDRNQDSELSNLIIAFPDSEGQMENFRIKEASILAPELQNRVPNIRSYIGESVNNAGTTIRFSVTPQGLHTMTLSTEKGTQFIDPYTSDTNLYMVYARRNLPFENRSFECAIEDEGLQIDETNVEAFRNANDGQLRTFRLALACTIEYASFHWMAAGLTAGDTEAAKKDAVLAAMVVTMTRVNALYENELSITMTLVPNNLNIVFVNSDTYSNNNGGALLGQNQTVIDNTIGSANYDIGHVFSTGGGGVAILNSPCVFGSKARGVTGLPSPVGDVFDYEYVAHEMGHQYGAPHTWNANIDSAACPLSQRSASNAYEPGSGSTIMGYGGLCGAQNVQTFTDIYFHQKSLQMIWANVTSGNSTCASQTSSGNTAPVAEAGSNYTIPISTPYKLTASSTDADGTGGHTYTWEQWNLGPAGFPTETTATGPLVRSIEGTTNPTRYIPNIPDLLDSPGSQEWERLVSVARNINFQVTVRDNDVRGGQTATDAMVANTVTAAGPFVVTSQNTNQIVWTPGETETITWNVAGTTGNGVNAATVNILLSTSDDPDASFDTVLAANVPNNGSYDLLVPSVSFPYCRIMIEAVGNIFFNINEEFFAIGNYVYVPGDICEDYPFSANLLLEENATMFNGFTLAVDDSRTISDFNVSLDVTTTNNAEIFTAVRGPWEANPDPLHFLARGTCDGATDLVLTFDDEGAPTDCNDTASNDNVLPFDTLSFADGEDSQGDWVLFIGDVLVDGNRATWNSVTLTICETGGFVPVLSTSDFELNDDFTVFPNPNNGNFTVKFNSASNDDINIEVYDIRGRRVYNKSFTNTGTFDQSISLDNVQSGMYLLNVYEGNRKMTKKIVIN